jgi:hypothetical protein
VSAPWAPPETFRQFVDEWGPVSDLARLLGVHSAHLSEMLKGLRSAPLRMWYVIASEIDLAFGLVPGLLVGDVDADTPLEKYFKART